MPCSPARCAAGRRATGPARCSARRCPSAWSSPPRTRAPDVLVGLRLVLRLPLLLGLGHLLQLALVHRFVHALRGALQLALLLVAALGREGGTRCLLLGLGLRRHGKLLSGAALGLLLRLGCLRKIGRASGRERVCQYV